jgi:hypothetical protein
MAGIQAKTLVTTKGRHPLRHVMINAGRQGEEILHLFSIGEVNLEDSHGSGMIAWQKDFFIQQKGRM